MSVDIDLWFQKAGEERAAICIMMAERLTNKALRKKAPFNQISYQSALEPYAPYMVNLSDEEQVEVIEDLIESYKAKIGGAIYINQKRNERLALIEKARTRDYAKNYKPIKLADNIISNTKVKDILDRVIKERYPDFKRAKSPDANILRYSKKHLFCESIDILFDQGSYGPGNFVPLLGVSKPYYTSNLGDLAGVTKTSWRYVTEQDCMDVIHDILNIVDIILPLFEQTVEDAITYVRKSDFIDLKSLFQK